MIKKELVINTTDELINIALLEDGQLVEFNREEKEVGFSVGDLYLGKVKKTMSGLNACFVDIGHERDAFLHYADLGTNFKSFTNLVETARKRRIYSFPDFPKSSDNIKFGKITDAVSSGKFILTQVIKEAISTKGPRVTTDISIPGRRIVLLPFDHKVSVSQKIRARDESKRLNSLVKRLLPSNFGAIVRTAATGATEEELAGDIRIQIGKWKEALDKLSGSEDVKLILSESSRANTILRDRLDKDYSAIHIDDKESYEEINGYINQIEPDMENIVKYYKGIDSIFDHFEITRQIKSLFGKIVSFKRKSYMIVEHTEALHVIDINSGPRVRNADSQEDIAFEVNSNAVEHVARQLRLRDMGGIIVIDFIDMRKAENREKIFEMMREAMRNDRSRHTILPLSKFGLMQITRQRVRSVAKINNRELCPTCRGTGKITSSLLFDSEIENQISTFVEEMGLRYIKVKVHPFIAAYLKKGFISKRVKWMFKYRCNIVIVPSESMGYVDAKYYSSSNQILTQNSISDYEADIEENK